MSDSSISLNKFISQTGICSRRKADTWIDAGRVKINGVVARKGNRVEEGDEVTIDDQPIRDQPKSIYIAFNKPPGVTSTTDLSDPDNIIDYINHPQRIFPIGRLDKASTGLILLTNDGDIVNELLREEYEHEKEYIVKVNRSIDNDFINRMSNGLPILGTVTKKCQVERLGKQLFRIILTQGLNRQIRRMCEYLGYRVVSLKRIRFQQINLENLAPGKWRNLSKEEVAAIKGE
jgi:23S rRNA pseudouridine2604 synthase